MAAPEGPPRSGWELFEQLGDDVQQAIAQLVGAAGIKSWRATCRAARQLLNARVRTASVNAVDVPRLSLVQRFPGLRELTVVELAAPTSLTRLHLYGCKALSTAGLVALERYCPQLRSLTLQGAGATLPLRCSQPVVRLFALGVNLDG
jgi:hypothetical protein